MERKEMHDLGISELMELSRLSFIYSGRLSL